MPGDWTAIERHQVERLERLFERDPDRLASLGVEVAGLYFDWSKTHLDSGLIDAFIALAQAQDFTGKREALL